MSHFVVVNFMAHFCLLWCYFSVYFCKLLRILNASQDFFPYEEKKKICQPDTFQKEDIQQKLLCFLRLIYFEEFKAHVRTFKRILRGDE